LGNWKRIVGEKGIRFGGKGRWILFVTMELFEHRIAQWMNGIVDFEGGKGAK
jgi:hypothetical protein